jgi:hypothetical protein
MIFPRIIFLVVLLYAECHSGEPIAIDLGGKAKVLLAESFYHVVAVEQGKKSSIVLPNVTICHRPVRAMRDSDGSITFKQLIYDYVYENELLIDNSSFLVFDNEDRKRDFFCNRNVTLIQCDLDGGEEDLIEDILHFAYYNKTKVYLRVYTDLWKNKKISDFEYLFKFFEISYPEKDCLILMPLEAGVLIKKNLTAVVIAYNLVTCIRNMVNQLAKYTSDIVVIDNGSFFPPLLDYYEHDFLYTVLRKKTNLGPRNPFGLASTRGLIGDIYIMTDPDLQFNPELPQDFIQDLIDIQRYFGACKVGFCLCYDAPDINTKALCGGYIEEDKYRLAYPPNPSMDLYRICTDTTFCLVNRRITHSDHQIRVGKNFRCLHLPWHKGFKSTLIDGELDSYLSKNCATSTPTDAMREE